MLQLNVGYNYYDDEDDDELEPEDEDGGGFTNLALLPALL